MKKTKSRGVRRALWKGCDAVYHVIARTAGQAMLFGAEEKDMFRRQMRAVACFCGVEVMTYCLLDNHVHLLVRVPGEKPELTDEALLSGCEGLYGGAERSAHALNLSTIRQELAAGGRERDEMRALLIGRMCDLSMFAKLLKQRFSIWYNRRHGRHGTLWSDRFRSVLVEGKGLPLATVAAYIDLNAVRAGIVNDPAAYAWSGYGEAVRGGKAAQRGIGMIVDEAGDLALAHYSLLVYGKGVLPVAGKPLAPRISPDVYDRVRERYEGLSIFGQLRERRVRCLSAGVVFGTASFVESWFRENEDRFPLRQSGARKLRSGDWGPLRSFRDLQKDSKRST